MRPWVIARRLLLLVLLTMAVVFGACVLQTMAEGR